MTRLTIWIVTIVIVAPCALEAQSADSASEQQPATTPESEPEGEEKNEQESNKPVVTPPRLLQFVEATYPEAARTAGLETTVELEITIGPDGRVTDAIAMQPVGNGFDEAAIEAAKQFVFEPAKRDGQAVASRIRYAYIFEIREVAPQPTPQEQQQPELAGIEGKVIDRDDDEPIAKVEVLISNKDGSISQRALTDEQGGF